MILLIDGYNFLKRRYGQRFISDAACQEFVDELAEYAEIKGHEIALVFDGAENFSRTPSIQSYGSLRASGSRVEQTAHPEFFSKKKVSKGCGPQNSLVRVIYSEHETADAVIMRMLEKAKPDATIVVTSDNELARSAHRLDIPSVEVDLFAELLERAFVSGGEDSEETSDRGSKGHTASKIERRLRAILKKL